MPRPPENITGSADGVDLTVAWPLYALLAAVAAEPYPDGAVWLERDGEGGHVIVTFGAVRRSLAPREGGP